MTLTSGIVSQIVNFLNSVEALSGRTIVAAYDSDINPVPISNGIVSVGIDSVEIGEKNTSVGTDGAVVEANDRDIAIKLKITFFVPYSSGCVVGYDLFDKVYTALLFSFSGMKVTGAICGDTQYKRETESLVTESVITLTGKINN